jgi:hypothetical protein
VTDKKDEATGNDKLVYEIGEARQVTFHCEPGSNQTILVNSTTNHYHYPDWIDKDLVLDLLEKIKK